MIRLYREEKGKRKIIAGAPGVSLYTAIQLLKSEAFNEGLKTNQEVTSHKDERGCSEFHVGNTVFFYWCFPDARGYLKDRNKSLSV